MPKYLVTYDVRVVDQENYPGLYAALGALNAVAALDSVWLVETQTTAKELFAILSQHLTEGDLLLVMEIATPNNWWSIQKQGALWMKQRKL